MEIWRNRNLTKRLLKAFSIHERVAMIPKLLQFQILTDRGRMEESEFVNPFYFVGLPKHLTIDRPVISDKAIDVCLSKASSEDLATRRWAVITLGKLHDLKLLGRARSEQFGDVLWSQTGEDGMPSSTHYYRHVFLELPHPSQTDPVQMFMQYVRGARFPAQQSKTQISINLGGMPRGALCVDLRASKEVPWSDDDVRSIVRRLIEWWDADKEHWKEMDTPKPVLSMADEFKRGLSELVVTLAAMIVRRPDSMDDESSRNELKRVVDEFSEYKMPALSVEMACVSLFPDWREPVLCRVEDEMVSTRDEVVLDALTAIHVASEQAAASRDLADTEKEYVLRLLRSAIDMIRWQRKPVLSETINAVRDVLTMHPWTFDNVERSVLVGLHRLIGDTAVHRTGTTTIDENGSREDVSAKLLLRRAAACLAYRLFEHYQERGEAIPETITAWEKVCQSDDEFAEIRNQWILIHVGGNRAPDVAPP